MMGMPCGIIRLSVTGDIICKREMCEKARTEKGFDFSKTFSGIKHLFDSSDIVIGNLETPVSGDGQDLVSERRSFCAPREFAEAVFDAGIRFVSTANNHALDRGIEGLNETIHVLDDIGFTHTGTFEFAEREPLIIKEKELGIGILSYTYGTNAHHNDVYLDESEEWRINLFQKQEFHNRIHRGIYKRSGKNIFFRYIDKLWCLFHPEYIGKAYGERRQPDGFELLKMSQDIDEMKKAGPDLTLMCMHIGGQYNEKPSAYTLEMTKRLEDLGINIIVGNHEHRIHGCDLSNIKKGRFAAYCLGNLIGTAGVIEAPFKKDADYSVICHIDLDPASKEIRRISYNIIRSTLDDTGIIQAMPAYFLFEEGSSGEKGSLREGIIKAARAFSGDGGINEIREEYTLYEAL